MTVSDFSSCFDDGKFFPPGFRFHPTDEELVLYYLKRKMCRRRLKLDIIGETDVYKWDPEELPGLSKLKTGDRQWFFFSPRDRKYPNGARSNRATLHGYWKATGKDRTISCNSRSVGVKKTLVFYNGRAPAGIRTDWVMHEYTLDEEELKRCESAKDYYALYKVYKKSGPGPKNGEQYGAPFKEEEWADDECLEVDAPVMEGDKVISVENAKDDYDFDEFLKRIADEEPVLDPQLGVLNQLFVEEEANSTLVGGTQSGVSQFQFYEGPEVTSGPGQQGTHLTEEDFLEDFLEMDDLIGPEPNVQNFKDPMENSLFDEMSRLNEVGLFQDPSVLSPTGPGEILQQYMQNQNENSFSYNINSGAKDYTLNGESNAVPNPYLTNESQIDGQIWTQDQRRSVFTPTEANQGVIPPLSGAVYDCNLANIPNQIGNGSVNEDDSWFSSALWSWLESVPTDTASAAENPISNGACKGSANTIRNDTTTGTAPKRLDRSKSVFLCFLILGIFCAMLSVLIRTTMNVSGRYIY